MAAQTPSQTVGPFFSLGLIRGGENDLVQPETRGQVIMIRGTVYDGKDKGVRDAVVETWQPDAQGIFSHPADPRHKKADPNFFGFARAAAQEDGSYWIRTIKPGAIPPENDELFAPYINVRLFMRGMLIQAHTRLYFPDEVEANAQDPVLSAIESGRRETLIAKRHEKPNLPTYRFDLRVQGKGETVFFDP
jgi:protocatechuate 3,4-dioxygenase alpha subunit